MMMTSKLKLCFLSMLRTFKGKFFYFFLAIFLLSISARGQHNDHDSLLQAYRNNPDETKRLQAYHSLTYQMMWKDLDSAWKMLDSAGRWTKNIDDPDRTARQQSLQGAYFWFAGKPDSALKYYHEARIYSKAHQIDHQYMSTLSNIGALLTQINMIDSAAKMLEEALTISQKLNDRAMEAKIHFNLGNLYNKKEYNHLALEHQKMAEQYQESIADSVKLTYTYIALCNTYEGIGNVEKSREYGLKALSYDLALDDIDMLMDIYNNLAVLYWLKKMDLDSARYYFNLSYDNFSGNDTINRYFTYLMNLGGVAMDANDLDQGLNFFKQAAQLHLPYPDAYTWGAMTINTGLAYMHLNEFDSARDYLNRGLNMARQVQANENILNAYSGLFKLDTLTGDYYSAMHNLIKWRDVSDSIDNEDVHNKIAELDIMYETKKKDAENEFLRTQNELKQNVIQNQRIIFYVIIASLLVLGLFTVLIIRSRRILKRTYLLLQIKNKEVTTKNQLIEEKNRSLVEQKNELSRLNQTKDKFFSIIAHDLRSPFNALLGFLEMLETDFDTLTDTEKLNIIRTLSGSSRNTYNLLVNLLEWSRSQRGMIKSFPAIINLHKAADEAIHFLQGRFRDKHQDIANQINTDVQVYADINLSRSIFINLINNAIKFTPHHGNIIIRAAANERYVEFSIRDTGIGIPEGKISDLFGLSSDFTRSGTDREPGTGLGLIMCKEFVSLMNGQIRVESTEGAGTTFYVRLPGVKADNEKLSRRI